VDNPEQEFVAVVDEMNLARVEYYFAEVLSRMEDDPSITGAPRPLVPSAPESWGRLHLPSNLLLVGTVNMDESTHGFSRKVLDRAFTLEFSRVELAEWRRSPVELPDPAAWPSTAWQPRARTLNALTDPTEDERRRINSTITELEAANSILQRAQLQVGYRVRDELALFTLHAHDLHEVFVDGSEVRVDPLDVGLTMKLLPRIAGGNDLIRDVLIRLLGWAARGESNLTESRVTDVVETWREAGAEDVVGDARLPRTTARLCLMWSRLEGEGFTSYWL
jgi:5-methylcytosine-specific restriction enzyme B